MANELGPLTRLIMVAESLDHDTCPECGSGDHASTVLREVHAALTAADIASIQANLRLRAALGRRVRADEFRWSKKPMSDDEVDEWLDHIERGQGN